MQEVGATLTVSWQALSAIVGVLVIVVGMSTGYLKLFMQARLIEMEKNILKQIKAEFQDKEMSRIKEAEFERRISTLEGAMLNKVSMTQ